MIDVTALATDYDETLAEEGLVSATTLSALWKLKDNGRRLVLFLDGSCPTSREFFRTSASSTGSWPKMEPSCSIQPPAMRGFWRPRLHLPSLTL
ncbi:hypothetical protein ACHMW4_28145 [Mesorhizobium sp. UC22_110]|uniref:hypothetical protein n=1 Tax=Mesorhizobium sp. UC22_110 TaxID=3374552 RepID=UPI003756E98C